MTSEQILTLNGQWEGTLTLRQQGNILRLALALTSPAPQNAALYLVDSAQTSWVQFTGRLHAGQRSWEGTLSPLPIFAGRAGACIIVEDRPVSQGFADGEDRVIEAFHRAPPAASLPDFRTCFPCPQQVDFLPHSPEQNSFPAMVYTALHHPSTWLCIRRHGGFYTAQYQEEALLLAVPCQLGVDPLPFLPWRSSCSFVPGRAPAQWGCVLLGAHLEQNLFFPVVLE
ncbi:MAG: hypothetical protein ACOX7F_03120 [Eubacteriales bacterium]